MSKQNSIPINNARLKKIRETLNCPRKNLSRWTGISEQMLYYYETPPNVDNPASRAYNPSAEEIVKLCAVLKCEPREIVCEDKFDDFIYTCTKIQKPFKMDYPVTFNRYEQELLALKITLDELNVTHKKAPLLPLVIAINTFLRFDETCQEKVINYINTIGNHNNYLSKNTQKDNDTRVPELASKSEVFTASSYNPENS